MNFFTWYMGANLIDIGTYERLRQDSSITNIAELDSPQVNIKCCLKLIIKFLLKIQL